MNYVHILLTKTHPVLRKEIYLVIQAVPGFVLIGQDASEQETSALTQECHPDILILDLEMLRHEPAGLVGSLYKCRPQMKMLILSNAWSEVKISNLVMSGVSGYFDKVEISEKLEPAIHTVINGGFWFCQTALSGLISSNNSVPIQIKDYGLTNRELDVLHHMAKGETNREIALALEISIKTVEKCLTTIYEKLGKGSRVETAVWAAFNGYI